MRGIAAAIGFASALLVGPLALGDAAGATITVRPDGTGDYPTIQSALDAAQVGDVIRLATGVYTGPGMVDLDPHGKQILIESEDGQPGSCVLDCMGSEEDPHRGFVFITGEGEDTVVRGLTLLNGTQTRGGALYCERSSPTFENCVFAGNRAILEGGVLYCGDSFGDNSSPLFRDCRFQGNLADSLGGVAHCNFSLPRFEACVFLENESLRGGAISCNLAVPSVTGSLFLRNKATLGGALHCVNSSAPRIERSTFHANEASARGAAMWSEGSVPIFDRVIVTGSLQGGAIRASLGVFQPELSCCNLYGNTGGDYVGGLFGQRYVRHNISADPRYCDIGREDFTLAKDSPCAPESSTCGRIGAFDVTCDESPVEDASWGTLKGRFH